MKTHTDNITDPALRMIRRQDGHVYLEQGTGARKFDKALSAAMPQPTETDPRGNMEEYKASGERAARWARAQIANADRSMVEVMTSQGAGASSARNATPMPPVMPEAVNETEEVTEYRQDETGFDGIIAEAASRYRLPEKLIRAVIRTESAFNPNATSPVGARGLMQLMPFTAKALGVTDAYDPRQNVLGGSKYLRMMLDRYNGNITKALAAYNWGPGRVDNGLQNMPTETRNYLSQIFKLLEL